MQMLADPEALAERAAEVFAEQAQMAVARSGLFRVALSGGSTPRLLLRALAERTDIVWPVVHVFQVDERVASEGAPERNLTMLHDELASKVMLGGLYPMPVEADDLDAGAVAYAEQLAAVCAGVDGLDLVQLGLGGDGHTASLVPGDPVLGETERSVAVTEPYQGRRRMTLTAPELNRSATRLWIISGESKHDAVTRLLRHDQSIPAGLLQLEHAIVLTDDAAMLGRTTL